MDLSWYYKQLEEEVKRAYEIAKKARAKLLDPSKEVEILIATELAGRVESLVSILIPELRGSGLRERILELESELGKGNEEIAFIIADEVASGKFASFDSVEKAIEAGLRVGLAYLTLGIVTAPLEGMTHVKLKKRLDGKDYLAVYFAGPIRSAGGTTNALAVVLADFLRKKFGISTYDATPEEIERYAIEMEDYHTRVTRLQYMPSKEEIAFIVKHLPVEVTGEPTENKEVLAFKDLPRVETNRIRGGMVLTMSMIALKAPKLLKRIKKYGAKFGLSDWLWLEELEKIKERSHAAGGESGGEKATAVYLEEIPGGRPVFSHPSARGGFRLRYGRARNTGFAAVGVHPATMAVVKDFLAVGTQIKLEYPGKAAAVVPVDSIEGPIVRLKNGDVIKLKSYEEAKKIRDKIDKILYLGDMLIAYGEFLTNGKALKPSAWVEEWWLEEVRKHIPDFNKKQVSFEEAVEISKKFNIPLHPAYTYFWEELSVEEVVELKENLGKWEKVKPILEKLGVEHKVRDGKVLLSELDEKILRFVLSKPLPEKLPETGLELVNMLSPVPIRAKAPSFVGARMGRPEKAERRIMKGRPHVLFPAGHLERMRNVVEALKQGIKAELALRICPKCGKRTYYLKCPRCGAETVQKRICQKCGAVTDKEIHCGLPTKFYVETPVKEDLQEIARKLGMSVPDLLKGVKGLSSEKKIPERLEKGLLRAKYDLAVNKDGTIRVDATDLPLTHFKPKEIGVSVEKLRELGYTHDIYGNPLVSEDQVLELLPQDILLPDTPEFSAAEYFVRVANFVDELLVKFYGLEPYYNVKSKEDLIGKLVIGLAPHTSAGIIGRIIGFAKVRAGYAHPAWHAAKKRNCLPGDALVITRNGAGLAYKKLEEVREGEEILSFDPGSGKTAFKRVKKVFARKAPALMLKVHLETGRTLELTPDHNVVVFEKGSFKVKKAAMLEEGDLVPVPLYFDGVETKRSKIDVLELLKNSNIFDELMVVTNNFKPENKKEWQWKKRGRIPIKVFLERVGEEKINKIALKRRKEETPRFLDAEKLAELLGWYVAEGYARKGNRLYQVCWGVIDDEVKKKISSLVEEVFGKRPKIYKNAVVLSGRIYYEIFRALKVGENAKNKAVPDFVLNGNSEIVKAFLRGFIEGDGYVGKFISIASVNLNLLKQVSLLFSRLGILTHFGHEKREITKGSVAEKYRKDGRPIESELYYLKIFSEDVDKVREFLEFKKGEDYNRRGKRVQSIGNLALVKVKKVEATTPRTSYVYDLEVEGTHTFFADSAFVHNCDGDEDSIMLLMDALLNFSREFLPTSRGGRSVSYDTLVFVRRNGKVQVVEAGKLIDEVLEKYGYVEEDGYEIARNVPEVIEVLAFDRKGRVRWQRVSAFIRHASPKELFLIRTRNGSIKVTGDHSLFRVRGNKIETVPSSEIKPGDKLLVARSVRLPEYFAGRLRIGRLSINVNEKFVYELVKAVEKGLRAVPYWYAEVFKALGVKRGKVPWFVYYMPKRLKALFIALSGRRLPGLELLEASISGDVEISIGDRKVLQKVKMLTKYLGADEVVEVRRIRARHAYVYDFSVPNAENFLCASGLIFAHNTMDVPLVLTVKLDLAEVDDEVHDMDIVERYPLEFYYASLEQKDPGEVKIKTLGDLVGQEPIGLRYTHETSNIAEGPRVTAYAGLGAMIEKVRAQLSVGELIRAVDVHDVAERILKTHFLKDIKGNIRTFTKQQFRCIKCNAKFRRMPLLGKCPICGGRIVLTVHEGTVKKYYQASLELANKYRVSDYVRSQLKVLEFKIKQMFGEEKQKGLEEWFGG